ncbi:hypothetical protein M918_00395 [Clostridium sp. BL8]|uniref:hypothetical protein n=1 Tax=Clostridium sp. BL8 TaxID=1354301 RepID=UPI00038A393E|nr:hypothetical protein [Clostridium sp. BL8]EQB90315.1 hypothetical protein M918_00395 [Clostridium sp. BL8]
MRIKDGVIPTVVGTVVTAGAAALRAKDMKSMRMNKHNIVPMAEDCTTWVWICSCGFRCNRFNST